MGRLDRLDRLELKLPPLALFAGCVAGAVLLAYAWPGAGVELPGRRVFGAAVIIGGVCIALAGVVQFRRAGTTVNPLSPGNARSVVTTGVFAWTRNPMYLGMAAALVGLSTWLGTWPALLVAAAFCAYLTRFQIVPEERALHDLFGEPYARYCRRVRRWI